METLSDSFYYRFCCILRVIVGSLLRLLDSLLQGFTKLTKLRLGSSPHVKWWSNTAISRSWPSTNQQWIGGHSKAFSRWIGSLFKCGSWTRLTTKKQVARLTAQDGSPGQDITTKLRLFFWMLKQNKNLIPPFFLKSKKKREAIDDPVSPLGVNQQTTFIHSNSLLGVNLRPSFFWIIGVGPF